MLCLPIYYYSLSNTASNNTVLPCITTPFVNISARQSVSLKQTPYSWPRLCPPASTAAFSVLQCSEWIHQLTNKSRTVGGTPRMQLTCTHQDRGEVKMNWEVGERNTFLLALLCFSHVCAPRERRASCWWLILSVIREGTRSASLACERNAVTCSPVPSACCRLYKSKTVSP